MLPKQPYDAEWFWVSKRSNFINNYECLEVTKMAERENRDGVGSTYLRHKGVDNIERNGERRDSHWSASSNRISRYSLLTGTLFRGTFFNFISHGLKTKEKLLKIIIITLQYSLLLL